MREWLQGQGVMLYVFAGCTAVGLISAFAANHGYKRLIKETEVMANTQNRLLKYIKLKFGSYYKLNMKPQDTRALAKHYLYKYKIGFMSAASWVKLSVFAAGVLAFLAAADLLWMLNQGKTISEMAGAVLTAVLGGVVLTVQNRVYNFKEKKEMAEWYLMDYLENFLKNKIESGKNLSVMAMEAQAAESRVNTGFPASDQVLHGENDRNIYSDNERKLRGDSARKDRDFDEPVQRTSKSAQEAAAASAAPAFVRPEDNNPYAKTEGGFGAGKKRMTDGDEVDARVVEDILREFLT